MPALWRWWLEGRDQRSTVGRFRVAAARVSRSSKDATRATAVSDSDSAASRTQQSGILSPVDDTLAAWGSRCAATDALAFAAGARGHDGAVESEPLERVGATPRAESPQRD